MAFRSSINGVWIKKVHGRCANFLARVCGAGGVEVYQMMLLTELIRAIIATKICCPVQIKAYALETSKQTGCYFQGATCSSEIGPKSLTEYDNREVVHRSQDKAFAGEIEVSNLVNKRSHLDEAIKPYSYTRVARGNVRILQG